MDTPLSLLTSASSFTKCVLIGAQDGPANGGSLRTFPGTLSGRPFSSRSPVQGALSERASPAAFPGPRRAGVGARSLGTRPGKLRRPPASRHASAHASTALRSRTLTWSWRALGRARAPKVAVQPEVTCWRRGFPAPRPPRGGSLFGAVASRWLYSPSRLRPRRTRHLHGCAPLGLRCCVSACARGGAGSEEPGSGGEDVSGRRAEPQRVPLFLSPHRAW